MNPQKGWAAAKPPPYGNFGAVLPASNARTFAFATSPKFLGILGGRYFLGSRAIVSVVYVTSIDLGLKPSAELDE